MSSENRGRHPVLAGLDGAVVGFIGAILISLGSSQIGIALPLWLVAAILVPTGAVAGLVARAATRRTLKGPDTPLKRALEQTEEDKRRDTQLLQSAFKPTWKNIPHYIALIVLLILVLLAAYANVTFGLRIPSYLIFGIGALIGFFLLRRPTP